MSTPQPKINDQYWFDLSETMIGNSVENLNKAIENISAMIIWGFGIYTGSSIFTIEYKKINEWWLIAILLMPYVLFIMSYWKAQVSKNPVNIQFDYRSPKSIREAYITTYKQKSEDLSNLKRISFITLLSLAAALIMAFVLKNAQKDVATPNTYLTGVFNKETSSFQFTGRFPADSTLEIKIQKSTSDTSKALSKYVDSVYTILNSHEGYLYQAVKLDTAVKKVIITVTYNDGEYNKSIEKKFLKEKPKAAAKGKKL